MSSAHIEDVDKQTDKLSVIPEIFFDLIARIVPGVVFLLGLGLAAPRTHDKLVEVLIHQAGKEQFHLGPMSLLVPLGFICAWVVGYLLQTASEPIEWLYLRGIDPMRYSLGEKMSLIQRLLSWIEWLCGLPILLFTWRWQVCRRFDQKTQIAITKKVFDLFGCSPEELNFWRLLDHIRTKRPPNSNGTLAVKLLAERLCARSLMLSFVIIALVIFKYNNTNYAHLVLPLFGVASIFSARLSYSRASASRRMLLSLLN